MSFPAGKITRDVERIREKLVKSRAEGYYFYEIIVSKSMEFHFLLTVKRLSGIRWFGLRCFLLSLPTRQ